MPSLARSPTAGSAPRTASSGCEEDSRSLRSWLEGWLAVLLGQGLVPRDFDPLADIAPLENLRAALAALAGQIGARAAALPTHREFIARRGAAGA